MGSGPEGNNVVTEGGIPIRLSICPSVRPKQMSEQTSESPNKRPIPRGSSPPEPRPTAPPGPSPPGQLEESEGRLEGSECQLEGSKGQLEGFEGQLEGSESQPRGERTNGRTDGKSPFYRTLSRTGRCPKKTARGQ